MSGFIIQLIALAAPSGATSAHDGEFLVSYDATKHGMRGEIVTTPTHERARRFESVGAAVRCYQQEYGTRPDGRPNRPLTAWTIAIRDARRRDAEPMRTAWSGTRRNSRRAGAREDARTKTAAAGRKLAPLTPRDVALLDALVAMRHKRPLYGWARVLDVGGSDNSHHASSLRKLVRRGLVETRKRGVHPDFALTGRAAFLAETRARSLLRRLGSHDPYGKRGRMYRITAAGRAALHELSILKR